MIHHDNMIEEIETNIDRRALELTGPQIRLFSSKVLSSLSTYQENTLLGKEILPALSEFLRQINMYSNSAGIVLWESLIQLVQEMKKLEH